jgi:hypothetical protein
MRFTRSAAAFAAALAALSVSPAQAGSTDAIIAGAAGFAVGTIFGNAAASPRYYYVPEPVYVAPPPPRLVYRPAPIYYTPPAWTPEWYAYCADRYVSFDARSGTYIGVDGYRYFCR